MYEFILLTQLYFEIVVAIKYICFMRRVLKGQDRESVCGVISWPKVMT